MGIVVAVQKYQADTFLPGKVTDSWKGGIRSASVWQGSTSWETKSDPIKNNTLSNFNQRFYKYLHDKGPGSDCSIVGSGLFRKSQFEVLQPVCTFKKQTAVNLSFSQNTIQGQQSCRPYFQL